VYFACRFLIILNRVQGKATSESALPLINKYQVPFWMKKARFVLISTFPEAIKEVWVAPPQHFHSESAWRRRCCDLNALRSRYESIAC
jgi:hypothetical protein